MRLVTTSDGSISAYNEKYRDYYHGINDGAILETLYKHIIPAFAHTLKAKQTTPIRVLDICFGLGYNSLFTMSYAKKWNLKVEIYSPEIDMDLLNNLYLLRYPRVLYHYLPIMDILNCVKNGRIFQSENITLSVFRGDANKYILSFVEQFFDVIYQDAFSPSKNMELWSEEYFNNLYRILRDSGIITTYSSARNVIYNARIFNVYRMQAPRLKRGSIFTKIPQSYEMLDVVKIYRDLL